MNIPIYVPFAMIDSLMSHECLDTYIAGVLIGNEDCVGSVNITPYKGGEFELGEVFFLDNLSLDLDVSFNHSDYGDFLCAFSSELGVPGVSLSGLASYVGLVHLNNACEKFPLLRFSHSLANLHRNAPSCVLMDAEVAGELTGGNTLLGIQNQAEGQKPLLQWQVGMMEYSLDCNRKRHIAVIAMVPLFFRYWS